MSSREQKAHSLSQRYTKKGISLDFLTLLNKLDSCSLISNNVPKAEPNISFVETSDSFAKLTT